MQFIALETIGPTEKKNKKKRRKTKKTVSVMEIFNNLSLETLGSPLKFKIVKFEQVCRDGDGV